MAILKLTECRSDIERLKGDMKETKKGNRKLQLRVQTFEKKLELQEIKEQQMVTMLEKANEEVERTKIEQETYAILVRRVFLSSRKRIFLFFEGENERNRNK